MSDSNATDYPILEGGVTGVLAWLTGYAVTYVLVAPNVRDSPLARLVEALDGEPATYEMVGWVFYNTHFVNTIFRDVPLIGSHTTSYIGGEDGFTLAMYLVPIGLLLAAGIGLARYHGAERPTAGAVVGLLALPLYLLCSIVGVFLFEVQIGGASATPDLLPAIFLAGTVYPILFAGGGGAIGGLLNRRDETATDA